ILSFFFSSRRRHTRFSRDWSSDVCSSDLKQARLALGLVGVPALAALLLVALGAKGLHRDAGLFLGLSLPLVPLALTLFGVSAQGRLQLLVGQVDRRNVRVVALHHLARRVGALAHGLVARLDGDVEVVVGVGGE